MMKPWNEVPSEYMLLALEIGGLTLLITEVLGPRSVRCEWFSRQGKLCATRLPLSVLRPKIQPEHIEHIGKLLGVLS